MSDDTVLPVRAADAEKSAHKTAVPGRPFVGVGDPRNGRGPAPGTGGRPPDKIRELARQIIHKRRLLTVLGKIARGEIEETALVDGQVVACETRNADRIKATAELAKIAGAQVQRIEAEVMHGIQIIERDERPFDGGDE